MPSSSKDTEGMITGGDDLLDMVHDPDMLQSIGLHQPKHATQCLKDVFTIASTVLMYRFPYLKPYECNAERYTIIQQFGNGDVIYYAHLQP